MFGWFNKIKRIGKNMITKASRRIGKLVHNISTSISKPQQLTAQDKIYIKFIQQSYKKRDKRETNINGFNYVLAQSSNTIAIYKNDVTKKVNFVVRGTASLKDAIDDLDIVTGSQSQNSRFKEDFDYFTKLYNMYSNQGYTMFLIGHSLGGAIVNYIGSKYHNVKGFSLNPGSGFGHNYTSANIQQVRSTKDIVSLLALNSNTKNIDLGDMNILDSHKVASFN